MTKLERVALAISGGEDPASILSIHRSRARAAIEAMREPTGEMVGAVYDLDPELYCVMGHSLTSDEVVRIWQGMVDALLSEKPGG